jgi:hypothetical protein
VVHRAERDDGEADDEERPRSRPDEADQHEDSAEWDEHPLGGAKALSHSVGAPGGAGYCLRLAQIGYVARTGPKSSPLPARPGPSSVPAPPPEHVTLGGMAVPVTDLAAEPPAPV